MLPPSTCVASEHLLHVLSLYLSTDYWVFKRPKYSCGHKIQLWAESTAVGRKYSCEQNHSCGQKIQMRAGHTIDVGRKYSYRKKSTAVAKTVKLWAENTAVSKNKVVARKYRDNCGLKYNCGQTQ